VKIYPIYPATGEMQGISGLIEGGEVGSDVLTTKRYLSISSDIEEFVLGKYWPRLSYDYNKEIPYELKIKKGIPKGEYIIGLEAGAPTIAFQIRQSETYGFDYTDPNIGASVNPRQFKVFVQVV